jgi:hypothetical protein
MLLSMYTQRFNMPDYPPENPAWNMFLLVGCVGVMTGLAFWWMWYRFTIQRAFTRITWDLGVGFLLTGIACLFFADWPAASIVLLVMLVVWAQGFTRQHFDKL